MKPLRERKAVADMTRIVPMSEHEGFVPRTREIVLVKDVRECVEQLKKEFPNKGFLGFTQTYLPQEIKKKIDEWLGV